MQITNFEHPAHIFSRSDQLLKTTFDYLFTLPALLFLTPLLLLIACAIKLESRGPFLHKRRAYGRLGQQFIVYKFRTVYVADKTQRYTRVGIFLRQTGLDELPKLFNVLNQTMSLVGPRFLTQHDLMRYGTTHRDWLMTKPGLTGLWQVNGRYQPAISKRVQLDKRYIEDWSIWLDLKILLSTVILMRY
ncbi:MAG: sugar transferase [Chloroflexota bacterium]